MIRKLAWFVGGVTLLASGAYIFVYLYRWEWNRALFVSIVFVGAEIALATALILRQLRQAQNQGRRGNADSAGTAGDGVDPRVLARLRAAPTRRDHFAWLAHDLGRTHVFITVLLGGGAFLSAGAWVFDRLAHHTAGRSADRHLAAELGALAFPAHGLVTDDHELIATEVPYSDDPQLRLLLGTGDHRR